MDDNVSLKSSDSLTTSGEYEIVSETSPMMDLQMINNDEKLNNQNNIKSKSPTLDIANNGDFLDLKKDMNEVIKELDKDKPDSMDTSCEYDMIPETVIELEVNDTSSELLLNDDNDNKEDYHCFYLLSDSQQLQLMDAVQDYKTNNTAKSSNHLTLPLPSSSSTSQQQHQQISSSSSAGLLLLSSSPTSKTSTIHSDLLSPKSDFSTPDINKVGHSVFYDCVDLSPTTTGGGGSGIGGGSIEKHDDMKPEKSDTEEEVSEIDQGCTIFSGVTYLGATNINSPRSECEIQKNIAVLNNETKSDGLKVSVSIPTSFEGHVVLYDAEKENQCVTFATYEVQRILYYARGPGNSNEQACFAFTWSHGETPETAIYQCHVFRCSIPEAVNQVSSCFQKAFQRYPNSLTGSVTSAIDNNSIMVASVTSDISGNPLISAGYEFIVSLEIREKVAKTSYSPVPRDKSCFKLRCNTDKEVCIIVKQTPSTILQPLYIERCFGVLLSPGKLVRQADMQLLDMVTMGYEKPIETQLQQQQQQQQQLSQSLTPYQIRAEWKANDKAFEQLNFESHKMFLTVAVDLVIKGIREPVRFVIETPVTIQSQSELRIMENFFSSKKSMSLRFYLQLKKAHDDNWEVSSIDPSEEIIEQQSHQSSILKGINNLSKMVRSSSTVSMIEDDSPVDYSSDGDEPLLSGTGEVSKDCPQDTLDEWDPVLKEWTDSEKRPRNLATLVRMGIPEALRGKVWQKLANVDNKVDMTDKYRTLITKETKCETVISRDIHRTFPAHKCFKETGGSGQDALFKVSKAYAVYDSEVGYCQGLSFIAASLLLHMPEEDAFCVLVALMYDYGLRDLYKQGFETLYMRLSQLNRLIKEHLPKLYEHFERTGIETHMFASQWFLTLFTARFPLHFVFHVLDVFLLDGMPILFQVAITLLSVCESDLKILDFEGILKYFRVTLPKKCRNTNASKYMKMACERKVKRLKQYEDEYLAKKRAERIEKENSLNELKFNDERKKFYTEIQHLQKLLEKTNEKIQLEDKKHINIVQDYKQIIQRQEQQITKLNEMIEDITKTLSSCQKCSTSIESNTSLQNIFGKQSTTSLSSINLINQKNLNDNNQSEPLNIALQRIRELELELAQAKLAQVEAECKNQDLNHQLNTTLTEIQSNRNNSWQPWLSKTINSIQEKVTTSRKDSQPTATFQSYMNPDQNDQKSRELSPKLQNRNRLNRNSIDIIQQKNNEHPVLREAFSFTSMK